MLRVGNHPHYRCEFDLPKVLQIKCNFDSEMLREQLRASISHGKKYGEFRPGLNMGNIPSSFFLFEYVWAIPVRCSPTIKRNK